MAYICNDCGNRSTRKFPAGRCPGCDSFNIRNTHGTMEAARAREPRTLFEIVILCLLWGLLVWGVWDRFLRKHPPAAPAAHAAPASDARQKAAPIPGLDE